MTAFINGQETAPEPNETILSAAKRVGIYIPTLCELSDINHAPGTCRVCLVEATRTGGHEPQIVTACTTPLEEGMSVSTNSRKVRDMQRLQVELLLADHNQDCATCIRHGDCELQDVAQYVGLRESRFHNRAWATARPLDTSSPALVRDMEKCIRCQRCIAVCRDIQGVDALVINGTGVETSIGLKNGLNQAQSDCVNCGQCVMVCPTGALAERDDTEIVLDYLYDPDIVTVFQFAPAVRVGFADETRMDNVEGQIIAALRKMGADIVLDTNFAADLVIMEEGTEVLSRIKAGKKPTFTSCCPAWINFAEKHMPEVLPYISSTKSPQQCLGAIAKTYLAEKMAIDPAKMRVISIMPCTAKKDERARPAQTRDGVPDVDVVLTIREFSRLLKREGIDLKSLEPSTYDNPYMGEYTGAGVIFGTTGGVMEAAVRTLYYVVNGKELDAVEVAPLRGFENVRSATLDLGGDVGPVKLAVCHGLKGARQMVEAVLSGKADFDFIEVMACPGGCMDGGGHIRPKKAYLKNARKRREALFAIDRGKASRQSHNNVQLQALYRDYLERPMSEVSHELLHTYYSDRRREIDQTIKEIWNDIRPVATVF